MSVSSTRVALRVFSRAAAAVVLLFAICGGSVVSAHQLLVGAVGGTSLVTPMFSGVMAIAAQ